MARKQAEEVEELDEELEDTEETEPEEDSEEETEKAAPKVKRGELPEGYVTPVGLAAVLTERKLYVNRKGEVAEVKPQMVYSYIKNAPKDHPFPSETVQDSLGNDRFVVDLEKGVQWWTDKNARAEARKASAADKAAKKATKKEEKSEEAKADEVEEEATEAE